MFDHKRSRLQSNCLIGTICCLALAMGCGVHSTPVSESSSTTGARQQDEFALFERPLDADGDVPWEVVNLLGKLSQTAYRNKAIEAAFQELGFEQTTPNIAGSMASYIVTRGPATVVVFRGTDDLEDWLVNLKCISSDVPGGGIHTGFHEAYQTLRANIHAALGKVRPKHLWITGHSLGGALAVVCANDLRQANHDVRGLVTFGQPMVGLADLAGDIDRRLPRRYLRFMNGADIVVRVPPHFTHGGSFVWFRREGTLHDREKIGPAGGNRLAPLGPPPLSEEEFKKVQQLLREHRAPEAKVPPTAPAKSFPFIDDHGMDEYLAWIRQRGVAPAGQEPKLPELPGRPGTVPGKAPDKLPALPRLP